MSTIGISSRPYFSDIVDSSEFILSAIKLKINTLIECSKYPKNQPITLYKKDNPSSINKDSFYLISTNLKNKNQLMRSINKHFDTYEITAFVSDQGYYRKSNDLPIWHHIVYTFKDGIIFNIGKFIIVNTGRDYDIYYRRNYELG